VLLRSAIAATAVVLLAGCGGSGKQAAPTTGSELPPGCSVDQVDAIVTAFLADPDLAPAPFFQLYAASESDQRAFRTRRRRAALTHLHARLASASAIACLNYASSGRTSTTSTSRID
jgi:hypothetical protein